MKKLLSGALLFAIVLCGCTHYYYVANVQNVPLLQEKKDLRVSAFFSGGDESNCIELQTAYAAGDKIGIMADFMTAWGGKVSDKDYGRGSYFDGAIGYFKPLSETLVFEIYGGVGISSQRHVYEEYNYDYGTGAELSFVKLFIQPSLGFKFPPLEIALSARTCRLSYTRVTNNFNIEYLNEIDDKSHYFIEPALTLRAGWENIKLQVQLSYAGYLGNPSHYFYEEAHLSGGLLLIIPAKKSINPDQTNSK